MQKLKFFRKFLPITIRARFRIKQLLTDIHRLDQLNIIDNGVAGDLVWVEIEYMQQSLRFHGYPSDAVVKHIFKKVSTPIKEKLTASSLDVALQIIRRFLEPLDAKDCFKKGKFPNVEVGSNYVECGAYTGFHVMRMSLNVGNNGNVLAIEAVPENFRILQLNIKFNNLTNVHLVQKAVWYCKTELAFYRQQRQVGSLKTGFGLNITPFKVLADQLDNILEDVGISNVDYVRIQVNGAEPETLAGMPKTLSKKPNLCVASLYNTEGEPIEKTLRQYLKTKDIIAQKKEDSLYYFRP